MTDEWARLEEQGKIYNPLRHRPANPALEIVVSKSGRGNDATLALMKAIEEQMPISRDDDWQKLIVKEP